MSSLMLSFETNDGVVLKYSDTGNGDRYKWNKDPLILVCFRDFTPAFSVSSYTLGSVQFSHCVDGSFKRIDYN